MDAKQRRTARRSFMAINQRHFVTLRLYGVRASHIHSIVRERNQNELNLLLRTYGHDPAK